MNRIAQPDLHPDADSLNAFAERLLPAPERARILSHLAGCARCREVVYLAQQAGAEIAPAAIKARPDWLAALSAWRAAWISAAALAALGGVALWVQLHPAQPPQQVAQVAAKPPAPAGQAPAAPQPTPAAPPQRQPGKTRASSAAVTERPARTKGVPQVAFPAGEARQAPATGTGPVYAPAPPPPGGESAPPYTAQLAEARGMLHGQAGSMAPATLSPHAGLTSGAALPGQLELSAQSLNSLARRLKLPSGLNVVSSASMPGRLVAVDSAGTVFLSHNAGVQWEPVPRQWAGKAVEIQTPPDAPHRVHALSSVKLEAGPATPQPAENAAPKAAAAPAVLFKLVTDKRQAWVSTDGRTWHPE